MAQEIAFRRFISGSDSRGDESGFWEKRVGKGEESVITVGTFSKIKWDLPYNCLTQT